MHEHGVLLHEGKNDLIYDGVRHNAFICSVQWYAEQNGDVSSYKATERPQPFFASEKSNPFEYHGVNEDEFNKAFETQVKINQDYVAKQPKPLPRFKEKANYSGLRAKI